MKLYELKRGSEFTIEGCEDVFKLHTLDGMYSVCTRLNDLDIVHLAVYTKVTPYVKVLDNF